MGLYHPRTAVSKYYSILFSLPHWKLITLIMIFLLSLTVVLLGKGSVPFILNTVFVLLTLVMYRKIHGRTVFWKLKRITGMSLTILIYSILYYVLSRDWRLSSVSSAILFIIVLQGLDGTSWWRYIIGILPSFLTVIVYENIVSSTEMFDVIYPLIMSYSIIILLNILIYEIMGRRRINGFKAPDIGSLFLQNWLNGSREIEEVFERLGVFSNVSTYVVKSNGFALIYTDLHYGPFSNTGSSQLPMLVREDCVKVGLDVFLLHGFGSHDRNIASSKYMKDYLRQLIPLLFENCNTFLKYHGAFKNKFENNWEVTGIVFDKVSFLIVSRPLMGIDDLPYEFQTEYGLKAKEYGLGDLILIDAHNWEKQEEIDLHGLRKALDESLSIVKELRAREPEDTFVKHHCFTTQAPGLIKGEVCILQIRGVTHEKVVLLLLRGNNMAPGLRDTLLGLLRNKLGNDAIIEVLTNDEHTETGVRANITYIPVHNSEQLTRDLSEHIDRFNGLKEDLGICLKKGRMNVKLMGDAAILLEKILRESYVESAVLLVSYAFLTPWIVKFLWNLMGF
ncbi:MAG: DUF2070 family protein [Thermosphaera sp.]